MNLTKLPGLKHGVAVVCRLCSKEKSAAETLSTEAVREMGGVDLIFERLEKS